MTRGKRGSLSTASLEGPGKQDGYVLLVRAGDGVELVRVSGRDVVIGRDAGCEVVIDDEALSRRHARMRFDETITIEDLDSRNGTFVGGQRLAANSATPVRLHEAIGIAGVQIYVEPAPAPSRALKLRAPRDGIVVRDPKMAQLYAVLEVVANSPLRVLVL